MIGAEANTPTPGFAVHWANQLGASPVSIERLRGGINNRVFRCGDSRQHWVIKGYAPPKPGQRDRMQAEIEFLRFAAEAAPGFTPSLIQVDIERRCVVLEHLEGVPFPEGVPPSEAAVAKAVEFFRQLNAEARLARGSMLLDAAEGFLSLREHLSNVCERIEAMTCVHLDQKFRPKAETLLRQLYREQDQTEESISRLIDQGIVADRIDPDERCVSPSDFGFHNAIQTSKRICFIDFEFAGWDDPAKAILDFNLQPRVPIAKAGFPLLTSVPQEKRLFVLNRCKPMYTILRLKWRCIILAVLNPERLEQMLISMPEEESANLIQDRLHSASRFLPQR
jgi:hypothetical protein